MTTDQSDHRTGNGLPDHVTQPLLTRISASALDEAYEHAAARKALAGGDVIDSRSRRNRWIAPAVLAVFGLLVVIAAVQTSRDAATTEESREALVRQIGTARTALADKQEQLANLRERNTELQEGLETITTSERSATRRVTDLRAWSGHLPVSGPGVRIRLDNSPDGSGDGVVRDEDLATLVYGLWEAGAEAVAINDQRLTVLSGIRTVNRAIHVRTRPLTPPYVIDAIGDRNTLQADFAESTSGSEFFNLRSSFGFEFDMSNQGSLRLPGRNQPYLRHAEPYAPSSESPGVTS